MPRKRTTGTETLNRVTAGAIIRPYLVRIRPLVDRAVFIESALVRNRRIEPQLLAEAAELAEAARTNLQELDQTLDTVRPEVKAHSRVTDTRRALVAVLKRLEQTGTVLNQRMQ